MVIGLVGLVGMESEREVVVRFLREGRLVVVGLEGFPVGEWGEWYLGQAEEVRRVGWRCGGCGGRVWWVGRCWRCSG
ncbi:MAG: hypothetical protein QXY39_06740 [Thermofilaceae archaeon]